MVRWVSHLRTRVMERVWDYPRPPAVVPCERRVRVVVGGAVVADSARALRVLETSHPPAIYVPATDIAPGALRDADGSSWCEYKGRAAYHDVAGGDEVAARAAWSYPSPSPAYAALSGHCAFYPGRVSAAYLDDERVIAQPGDFYGGWITADLVGPFKGGPGTRGW